MYSQNPFVQVHHYLFKHKILLLLLALLSLLIGLPLLEPYVEHYVIIMSSMISVILISGIYIASHNRQVMTIAILLALLAFTLIWFNLIIQSRDLTIFTLILEIAFFGLTTLTILAYVMQYKWVTVDKIHGAICAYLLIGLTWALVYTLIETINPGSFTTLNVTVQYPSGAANPRIFTHMVYYSLVTMTTLGYGDTLPISNPARIFAALEAVTGQMFIAILIARLVGLHILHSGIKGGKDASD